MMRSTLFFSLLLSGLGADAYPFYPETADSYTKTFPGDITSYWACSYITGSDSHQYMLLGHTMWIAGIPMARASLLDLTDTSYYKMYLYSLQPDEATAISSDNVSLMNSYSNHGDLIYNLTYDATSQVPYNGGLGEFALGGAHCGEWAIPAARTEGTLEVRGKTVKIIPSKSFTWYDRQWGTGFELYRNYTWFQIHVPGTDFKASIWALDYEDYSSRIATIRSADGTYSVIPFEFSPSPSNQYHSPATGNTYPTAWTLTFPGRGKIVAKSIRKDQETYNTSSLAPAAYEAFSTFDVDLDGVEGKGYGLTEIVFNIAA
ncbi:hypothetical protein BJX64DRAFT_278664 [Aspergillus heterothallicus]